MKLLTVIFFLCIVHVELRRQNDSYKHQEFQHSRPKSSRHQISSDDDFSDGSDNEQETFAREKKYPSRKKVLDESENDYEQEKVPRTNRSNSFDTRRKVSSTTSTSYAEEASLCINEFDIKRDQLVKVKELKNGARMIRIVRIDEVSSVHGLDVKDVCMLHCCVEKDCELAMLSRQRTSDGFKCYLFTCNNSCTYAQHEDYTSMILKKEIRDDSESSTNKQESKSSDATSSTLFNGIDVDKSPHTRSFLRESSVILLLLVGLLLTTILLVLVGFYCRDSWKRGRLFKNRSTDADYLINGLYL